MKVKVIECPRDAMQGLRHFIPTERKASYINQLLKVGYDTIDFGSFVSSKAIPQMKDTDEVLRQLAWDNIRTKLLAIIVNVRGAQHAVGFEEITYLGFPLSISETFQQRNTNKSIAEALEDVQEMQDICLKNNKIFVTYISMGFGNPYGDPYNADIVIELVHKLYGWGIRVVSLADTIGISNPDNIKYLFRHLIPAFPAIEFGAHLHSTPDKAREKIEAGYLSGCKRFDGAIKGYGGCPMANDDLIGNVATETILEYFEEQEVQSGINRKEFKKALEMAPSVF